MKPPLACFGFACALCCLGCIPAVSLADDFQLRLRTLTTNTEGTTAHQLSEPVAWKPEETAVIVCDVWDYHHSLNAVQRLAEMLPRMNALLTAARKRGAIIIHAPSDCLPAYETHAARVRVSQIPRTKLPYDIASWCSRIPAEENQLNGYPIDQSDGGEDDDPQEHRTWSSQLESLGRNPNMPWKSQSPAIDIDAQQDYISDRGDEVWSILQHRKIQHVLMVGVHTNMCVLGRPFGLRQMVQQKMDVALVRDLTDCMYNPQRWPYVDHFTGNDLVISYVERCVCPTTTSDQILGGSPLRFKGDQRQNRDVTAVIAIRPREWEIQSLTRDTSAVIPSNFAEQARKTCWLRCSLRFPAGSLDQPASLLVPASATGAWLNGKPLVRTSSNDRQAEFQILPEATFGNDDANLLVLQLEFAGPTVNIASPPQVQTSQGTKVLSGKWEVKFGASETAHNIPLPAKFGMSPDVFYSLP